MLDTQRFLARLHETFPEVVDGISKYDAGLLHCEVGAFLRTTESALDESRFWRAEQHFRFVESALVDADAEVRNALEVSYLEDLALGEWTKQRYDGIRERMPLSLRKVLIGHNPKWK